MRVLGHYRTILESLSQFGNPCPKPRLPFKEYFFDYGRLGFDACYQTPSQLKDLPHNDYKSIKYIECIFDVVQEAFCKYFEHHLQSKYSYKYIVAVFHYVSQQIRLQKEAAEQWDKDNEELSIHIYIYAVVGFSRFWSSK